MQKKTKGLVAGAAGVALMLSGTTLALWSDSDTVDGAELTAGNLDVSAASVDWADVSGDRSDKGHSIDLSKFKIIPGDTIQGTFDVTLDLEGENMAAKVQYLTGQGTPISDVSDLVGGDLVDGLDADIDLEYGGISLPLSFDDLTDGVVLYSHDNGNADPAYRLPSGNATVTATVTVTFDEDTSEQNLTKAQATLANSQISLEQVRANAHGYN